MTDPSRPLDPRHISRTVRAAGAGVRASVRDPGVSSSRRSRPRIRSAISRSTTTPACGSNRTGSCSTSSSTRPRSRPSRRASASTPTATATSPTPRPTPDARPRATALEPSLALTVDGVAADLVLDEAGLTFPSGVGGLNTMRIVCGFSASLGARWRRARASTSPIRRSRPARLARDRDGRFRRDAGRRGDRDAPDASASDRLPAYPTNLLTQALADTTVALVATPGGPTLPPLDIADASPLAGRARSRRPVVPAGTPVATAPPVVVAAPAVGRGAGWRDRRRAAVDLPLDRPVAASCCSSRS